MNTKKTRIALAVVLLAVGLWATGRMDPALSKVGLNRNACVTNSFGATFCGDDARTLCKEIGGPACSRAGYDTTGSALGGTLTGEDPAATTDETTDEPTWAGKPGYNCEYDDQGTPLDAVAADGTQC